MKKEPRPRLRASEDHRVGSDRRPAGTLGFSSSPAVQETYPGEHIGYKEPDVCLISLAEQENEFLYILFSAK